MVASLLAVGASPAAAIDDKSKADHTTKNTACLGPATADAGFTDTVGLGAEAAINCLAYYGITTGKTADKFDPGANVTRSQMALFLSRTAKVIGVDLMGGTMAADFGDIADQGEDRQAAIKALARNGILMGRSSMSFMPDAEITRTEMAVALVALLDKTPGVGLSKATSGDNKGLYVFGSTPGTGDLPNDSFSDAYAAVSQPVNNAISAAYELGITTGKPAGSDVFDPNGTVPRKNMASFITRALAHSNVRPAGLTAQLDGAQITVSVRDANFAPVVNQAVDAFKTAVAYESKALKADGTCSSRTSLLDGATKCQIDGADSVTQSDGNVTLAAIADVGDGQTVWIWQGDLGDKVDSSTEFFEISVPKGAVDPPAAASAIISTDLPKQPGVSPPVDVTRVHFGTTVTFTIQLQGDPDSDANTPNNVNVGPPSGNPTKYTVTLESFNGDNTNADNRLSQTTQPVTIGPDGSGSFTASAADPGATTPGNFVTVRATVAFASGPTIITVTGSPVSVVYSDESAKVEYVTIAPVPAQVAPGTTGNTGNAVTVTAVDQFGQPVKGAGIVLKSNNPTGTGDPDGSTIRTTALLTGNSGTVRIGYSYTGNASEETLVAMWDGHVPAVAAVDLNNDGDTDDPGESPAVAAVGDLGTADVAANGSYTCETEDECGDTKVYWVRPSILMLQTTVNILSADTDNDQIVVDLQTGSEVTPTSVNYDGNDYFTVITRNATDTADVSTPSSMEDFEAALTKALADAAKTPANDQPTLAWDSYVFDDPTDIASFTLDVTTS